MSEFMFLFRATLAEQREVMGTPERAQRSLQAWLAWVDGLEAKGHLKSRGKPLERGGKVARHATVTDGPYAESKDVVLGFLIVEAADLDEAARLAIGCPMMAGGGSVEIRPVAASPA